jgi:hypothetical protein
MGNWQIGKMAKWETGETGNWRNGKLAKWEIGETGNGEMAKWEMVKLEDTLCRESKMRQRVS